MPELSLPRLLIVADSPEALTDLCGISLLERTRRIVRQLMIDGYEHPEFGTQAPRARGVVNQRVGRIKRRFKWGVGEELVPPEVFQALTAIRGMQRVRTAARETEPVAPVAVDLVESLFGKSTLMRPSSAQQTGQ